MHDGGSPGNAVTESAAPRQPAPRTRPIQKMRRAVVDFIIAVFALPAGLLLRRARRAWPYMPLTRKVLRFAGVFPVREHFYEPVTHAQDLRRPLDEERTIPGLDLNGAEQRALLGELKYAEELRRFPLQKDANAAGPSFFYHNGAFEGADAGMLYSMIRRFRPRRMIEIGSGNSTLIARAAIARNQADDAAYSCRHVCIEPYGKPWLEEIGAEIVRSRVELCDLALFDQLEDGDILFVDSSHVIRPQGDVLYEVLEVFGRLKAGVLIHVHDMFTPRDYIAEWVLSDQRLWDEQYLIEAFLAYNREFKIVAALNYLYHNHPQELLAACPIPGSGKNTEPRSFWMRRV
jgi:hypothetical protein